MNSLDRYAPKTAARIARKLVAALLAAGYALSVDDGEEITVRKSTDAREIIDALATTDHDYLRAYYNGETIRAGWVMLIWGNDEDVISDWSWCEGTTAGDAFNALMDSFTP